MNKCLLCPVKTKEIIDIVCDLKNHSSPGFDGNDTAIVKRVIHIICVPLVQYFQFFSGKKHIPR